MNELTWSDRIGHRSRKPWLLLIKGDKITVFRGESAEGLVVVRGSDYAKCGKWSNTTYRLLLAPNVRAISGMDGWETGRFTEGLRSAVSASGPIDTWPQIAEALGVSVPSAMELLRDWRPKTAEELDEVDAQLASLDDAVEAEADSEIQKVTVSFGGPTNRQIAGGFWTSPKSIPGFEARIELLDPEGRWTKENIRVAGIRGEVISATHSSGYHGGYMAVEVALVPGTETPLPPEAETQPAPKAAPATPPQPEIKIEPKALSSEELKSGLSQLSNRFKVRK